MAFALHLLDQGVDHRVGRPSTYLVGDACATHERTGPDGTYCSAEQMHATALASLHGEFACVVGTADVLAGVLSMRSTPPA